jgi:hypothetical protein
MPIMYCSLSLDIVTVTSSNNLRSSKFEVATTLQKITKNGVSGYSNTVLSTLCQSTLDFS